MDQLNPGPLFECIGTDSAGPILTLTILSDQTCTAVFVSFSVKAMHLEPVPDLHATFVGFIAALHPLSA